MKPLFEEFPPVPKAEWLERIKKDLKGKSPQDFDWQVAAGVTVSAFPHLDDAGKALPHPIADGSNVWQICEGFQVGDPTRTNQLVIKALQGGAEALRFVCAEVTDFEALLQGVDLPIISFHFKAKKMEEPGNLLRKFAAYAGASASQIGGSFCWQGGASATEILSFANEQLPKFKVLPVHGSAYFEGDENTVKELEKTCRAANDWFERLTEANVPLETITKQVFFTVFIGKNYFLQIAKLRALRLLWANLQRAWGLETPEPAFVFAQFPLSEQSPDANSNLIQATTQAMSAVIGGVQVLTVLPSDKTSEAAKPSDFARRMARNVQHILRLESYFERVGDPAAGSYFIEELTEKLAMAAWNSFVSER